MRCCLASLYRNLHRGLWTRSMHVREQFPAGQGSVQLPGDLERLQAAEHAIQRGGKNRDVLQDGNGFLQAPARIAHAHSPMRNTGTLRPSACTPSMSVWLDPIIQSM